jgi:WD40 repeat protein
LAAASGNDIYLWNLDMPKAAQRKWVGHNSAIESIKWDQKGHLLASSAENDSQVYIWSPKSRQHILSLNDHSAQIRDFKWSHIDASSTNPNQGGVGFLITLSMDQTIKIYDINSQSAEC